MHEFIYLDYNATTPVDPRVAAAVLAALQDLPGNPSSSHRLGREARAAVESARSQVARLIGARAEEILFTGGGSESNNHVILGLAVGTPPERRHLVISAVEHPATVEPARKLEAEGWRVSVLPVNAQGAVDAAALGPLLSADPRPGLVSVMLANNEVGTLQPIAELAALCRAAGVPIHTDAAQAIGKVPVDVEALGVDFLSLAGHKFYAPKGVGALYLRGGRELPPLLLGAGQEGGRRAGTENVPGIVGLGEAAHLALADIEDEMRHSRELRDALLAGLRRQFGPELMRVNGYAASDPGRCLPGTLSVSFRELAAADLLGALGDRLAASAGAACNTDGGKISAVLTAMGLDPGWARGTLRLSVGRMSEEAEIEAGAMLLGEAVRELRR